MTPDKISQLFSIRCLGKGETVSTFDCGDKDLNDFILHEAVGYRQAHLAVTYLMSLSQKIRDGSSAFSALPTTVCSFHISIS